MARVKKEKTFRTVEEVMDEFLPNGEFPHRKQGADDPEVLSKQIVDALLPPFQKAILESESAKKQPRAKSKKK